MLAAAHFRKGRPQKGWFSESHFLLTLAPRIPVKTRASSEVNEVRGSFQTPGQLIYGDRNILVKPRKLSAVVLHRGTERDPNHVPRSSPD